MTVATRKNGPIPRISADRPGAAQQRPTGPDLAGRIRARAHEIFRSRTTRSADPVSDWLLAEHEMSRALRACDGDARASACAGLAQRIRIRAFQLSQERAGDALSDWLRAEREVGAGQPAEGLIEARDRARGEALLASGGD